MLDFTQFKIRKNNQGGYQTYYLLDKKEQNLTLTVV